jgi:excisionase family DNA binding protein
VAAVPSMTLQQAADTLGVHYMTVYRYVRQGRLAGVREGTQWRLRPEDVAALRSASGPSRRGAQRTADDVEGLKERMLSGDGAGAWWLIESHLGGGSDPAGALLDLVVPALRSVGDCWAAGEVSVAGEHRATAVAQRIVGRLGLQFGRRGKSRGKVALAAPSSDLHTLPVAIAADLLRWRGFDVLELGGNTPADALAEVVTGQERLLAVGIAATTRGVDAEVAECATSVREAAPGVPIFLGGAAIGSLRAARRLGGDLWSGSGANGVVDAVERIVLSAHAGSSPTANPGFPAGGGWAC